MNSARPPVTRERIAAVALALIDAEGTRAVTMRAVGEALGVRAPSLYVHVRGRAEILSLAHAAVIREIGPMPATGDWRADLRDFYVRMHRVFLAHGDIASLQFGAIPTSPESLAGFEAAIRALVDSGLPKDLAMQGTERLSLYVTADAYERWEFRRRAREDEGDPTWSGDVPIIHADADAAFHFGLDLLLGGLAELAG